MEVSPLGAVEAGVATPALTTRDRAKPMRAAPASMMTGWERPNSAADARRSPTFLSRRSLARRSIFCPTAHIVGDDGVGQCLRRTRNARDRVGTGRFRPVRYVLGLGADRITDSAADAFCLLLDLFRDAAEPLVVPRVGA